MSGTAVDRLLRLLREHSAQHVASTQRRIANDLGISSGRTSKLVGMAVFSGLVERGDGLAVDDGARRGSGHYRLTERGLARVRELGADR